MKLSPFLNMYVDYCFQFTSGVQALDQARRKRPQLERYIAQAEDQIRTANLVQHGPAAGGVVSLFDYLDPTNGDTFMPPEGMFRMGSNGCHLMFHPRQ